jgi:glycosyltransferase involved in cell wall biosynthesis
MAEQSFSIVVHSHLRWDFVWQRPQQILSRLAVDHPILFVEEPLHEPGDPHLRITEAQPNVLRAIPVMPGPCDVDARCEMLLQLLTRELAMHPLLAGRFETLVQWFYSPMCAPGLAGRLDEIGLVYDCMDELSNFRFAPPDLAERERFLLQRADVVFTGGASLLDAKRRYRPDARFFGCGVDVEHFSQARQPGTVVPPEVSSLPGPVLGYFGVIDERLDYELIGALAEAFDRGSIVMAGPLAKVEKEQLPRNENIKWLGQQPYAALPSLVKGFDVCLMPFALNEATRYINPTKTLEYMAGAKPIVSTAVADVVRNFGDVVHVAPSYADFIESVMRVLEDPDPARIAAGIEKANASTWDAIVATMRGHLVDAMEGRLAREAA